MTSPYDILFDPVSIGPVTAPNRFYQVPHCNGFGHRSPKRLAAMRGIKAEGGWGVVTTEEVEIHPSSDLSPFNEGRLWDDRDIAYHALTVDAIKSHGSLAGIELVHNGFHSANLETRLPPMAPKARPVDTYHPVSARRMDAADIRDLRQWHVDAAQRAKQAGYDIIYAYAGHSMTTLMHFLQTRNNDRADEYGGSTENRVRLSKEIISEMKNVVGDTCAIALRFSVDELCGPEGITADGEARDIVGSLAETPDLWDVNVSDWRNDSATARFEPTEGYQDTYTRFVKSLTSKPVVGVGRFTSPDGMAARIRKGQLDFIGAARPSIADPFLPNKIREGRIDEIRECIGCNICAASDNLSVSIRCTQNPTMGEAWRRNWHPERIPPKTDDGSVLVVGAGPAGMEAALQFANRGYDVVLAEASRELGGRLKFESALPGMSSYIRVRDYRENYLLKKSNVEIYRESNLSADDILDFGFNHIYLAIGSTWDRSGAGRQHEVGVDVRHANVFTPDDMASGAQMHGDVVVYDDDHYYIGGVVAEQLAHQGHRVTLVTPALAPSIWTQNTLEFEKIQSRLLRAGVKIIANHEFASATAECLTIRNVFDGAIGRVPCDSLLLATSRRSNTALFEKLASAQAQWADSGIETVTSIGDCLAPGTVANAVYQGHLAARCHNESNWNDLAFRREIIDLNL